MFYKKILFLFLFLLGCSATEEFYDDITAPDYVNSSKSKRLEIPPDLSEIENGDNFNVPGEAKSYKDYLAKENNLTTNNDSEKKKIISKPDGMKIIKSGNLRWLVVEKSPDLVWPHVSEFWEDLGFRIIIANKRTGIIETEWMDTDDIKLDQKNKGALSNFDKWLDSLSGFADKRKFRTRVEFSENGNTEIYISQRSAQVAEEQHARILSERQSGYNPATIYKIQEYKKEGDNQEAPVEISEQRKIDDYEIDSELLTRLMMKLGSSDLEARKKVNNPVKIIKSEYIENNGEVYIQMNDPYDRSWRRLGLALDIIGFVTEDKNRSKGIYYVRFSEIELPKESKKEEEGLIDSLIFWDHDDNESEDNDENYNDKISEDTVLNDDEMYTGIEAPEIKPIEKDYSSDEYLDKNKNIENEEETWLSSLWPSWGGEDEINILPDNEKRYRVRIETINENSCKVFLDYPSGKKNNSKKAKNVLSIINEYLK